MNFPREICPRRAYSACERNNRSQGENNENDADIHYEIVAVRYGGGHKFKPRLITRI